MHHERVVYWPALSTLLVADIHLGKEHVFQRAGMAIPTGPSAADIDRLSSLITQSHVSRLLVLGDLIHATPRPNEPWLNQLNDFLDLHSTVEVSVVAGNHDRTAGQKMLDNRIQWHQGKLRLPPFTLQHEPPAQKKQGEYVLCGHLHPAYRLRATNADTIRAPAFWFTQSVGVLPSFGEFTGGKTIDASKQDSVYIAGPGSIVAVQQSPLPEGEKTTASAS